MAWRPRTGGGRGASGQTKGDKESTWVYASGPMEVGQCLWREVASEGGLSAWGKSLIPCPLGDRRSVGSQSVVDSVQ
jgi:hypothetical protein